MTEHAQSTSRHQSGYTLVELVTVLIIIAILAVVVFPRLIATDSFSSYSLRDEFIAELRKTQLLALNNVDRCYRVVVTPSHYQQQTFGVNCSGNVIRQEPVQTLPRRTHLEFSGSDRFFIQFDHDGRANLACNGNCIDVIAEETLTIAIASEGYIYAN
ncbi:pilus assembly FimT family protein [Paraferrimonas haliotis]|uniref:MSHA biogenesis protein MshC n=1 Tax=Paraferrimonas haliotis TaxID=2013866 RepID=A0AA37TJG3_9GAMM|nr:prepilin-type N-terminal cleavage/methylation domain-containing protein [Paraferrimonas haliotis]GLS82349.1 MSHA biogenesis protein MshC [Paraferrimonas haliotis]